MLSQGQGQDQSQGQGRGQSRSRVNSSSSGKGSGGSGSAGIPSSLATLSLLALHSPIASRVLLASRSGLWNSQYWGKRDLNAILGYDDFIDTSQYRYAYERGGIARRIVEIFPRATWSKGFDVWETESLTRTTSFEKAVSKLLSSQRLGLLDRLIRASILAYLFEYSVLLIGAPGNPETELPRGSLDSIAYFQPLGQDKVKVEELVGEKVTDTNKDSIVYDPRYGQPLYYQVNMGGLGTGQSSMAGGLRSSASFNRQVHWTRIIHLTHNALDNDVCGEPILRPCWNLLTDLNKLTGGLSEAALRRGWPGLHANIDADANLGTGDVLKKNLQAVQDSLDDFNTGLENAIVTKKTEINPLFASGQIALKENAAAIEEQIATTLGAPMRWFRGAEVGQLASGQDKKAANDRISEERITHNNPVVRLILTRLHSYGYLPVPRNLDYEVHWPEEEELDEKEKAEVALLHSKARTLTEDEVRDRLFKLGPKPKTETVSDNPPDPSTVPVEDEDGGDGTEEDTEEDSSGVTVNA